MGQPARLRRCAELGDAEYRRERPAFFKSIHGTLNHLLGADRNWLARLRADPHHRVHGFPDILHDEFAALRAARAVQDEAMLDYIAALDERRIGEPLRFQLIDGSWHEYRLDILLGNVFNHQTHHRGQVHDMLMQTPVAPPPLDIIRFLREG